ncbi:methylaspartate mutase sigma subunit [Amycolatopsis xylanica]|uniref:Methylaspartate mutase sigma subunit n=1 Tax=Amycolatopsis xylanica TaxID=589385 RepID=A0A1H3NGM3_9PSEU|nr:cobalamin-dependent protein [Amycolatopsis xylanica]SDY88046.1 methylaspartate mutase sigma subunit [Amycolatopsis xylanica]
MTSMLNKNSTVTYLPGCSPFDAPQVAEKETVVVTSVASDSHTWNLVYLQLLIEELGYEVVNLGPCVPDELMVSECRDIDPAMVVISSVNGHGYQDGMRVVGQLREALGDTPMVIGGKLGIAAGGDTSFLDELLEAGFDDVFEDGVRGVEEFKAFVASIPARTARRTATVTPLRRVA